MRVFFCFLASLYCMMALPAHAADPCPPTQKNRDWSAQCFEASAHGRRVKAQYLRHVRPGKAGVAIISIGHTMELVAVDRSGRVVIPGIYFTGDFDYPWASDNRARFTTGWRADGGAAKCGYFDQATFKIVIPAVYDQCTPFHDGQAQVCTQCVRYCTDDDCHDSVHVNGKGLLIDRHNRVLHAGPLPTLDTVCGAPGLAKLDKERRVLECPSRKEYPFSGLE